VTSRTEPANGAPATKPRRRLPAKERRAAILESALEVFAKRGYNGSSIDEIAQAAGVSKALIYEHFPSKKHLHQSLLEEQVQEIFERLARSAMTPEPGHVRLRAGVNAFLEFVEERRGAFFMLYRDAMEPEVAELFTGLQRQATAAIAELIAADPSAPSDEAAKQDIEMLAVLLSGAVQSLAVWWYDYPGVPREHLVDQVMEFCWIGLERLAAGERVER
jgi:AcrR family transcriptional regulator